MKSNQQKNILHFWFGEISDNGQVTEVYRQRWWYKDPVFDQKIAAEFGDDLKRAIAGEYEAWQEDARSCLALIILLDQFSRHIYRDSAMAYHQDEKALALAELAIDKGYPRQLCPIETSFLYMPLMHSEDKNRQQHCVTLFTELHTQVAEDQQSLFAASLDFAEQHKAVIDRFGRYPHRNAVLGRHSNSEEMAFLKVQGAF
ncbi:MAG: DUF924 family protein [Gammaproteobacteria bacterium]